MERIIFITTENLKRDTAIDGSVDNDKLVQYIWLAQKIHIQNYLGTKLYDRLKTGVKDEDLNPDETILLNDYIQDALIHFSALEFYKFSAVTIANGGVFKHQPDNTVVADKKEIDSMSATESTYAEYFATRLVNFLCVNSSKYPLYTKNENDDIRPDKKVDYAGGFEFY